MWADAEVAEKKLKWPTIEVVWTLPRSFGALYPLTKFDADDWLDGGSYPMDWPRWQVDDCPDTPEVLAWRSACQDALDAGAIALFRLWKKEIEALGYEVKQIELHDIAQYQNAFGRQKWTDEQDDEFITRWVIESSDFFKIDWPTPPQAAYAEGPA